MYHHILCPVVALPKNLFCDSNAYLFGADGMNVNSTLKFACGNKLPHFQTFICM